MDECRSWDTELLDTGERGHAARCWRHDEVGEVRTHGRRATRHRRRRRGPVGELGAPARLGPGRALPRSSRVCDVDPERADGRGRDVRRGGRHRRLPRAARPRRHRHHRRGHPATASTSRSTWRRSRPASTCSARSRSRTTTATSRRVARPGRGQGAEDQGRLHVPVQPGGPLHEGPDRPRRPGHAVHLQRLRAELAVARPADAAAQPASGRGDGPIQVASLEGYGAPVIDIGHWFMDSDLTAVVGVHAQLRPGADDRRAPGRWPGPTSTTATSSSASSPAARSARCRAASSPSATTRASRSASTAARAPRSPGWSRSSASARR